MDAEQFRKAGYSAIDDIIDYLENVTCRRVVADVQPGYLSPELPPGPPEVGESWPDIQDDLRTKILPGMTHWQSPRFMAFWPSSVSYPSILGELYSAALTAPAFNWITSPAVTELETIMLDWLAKAMALPECFLSAVSEGSSGGGGVIQGSASEATAVMMVVARERYLECVCKGLEGFQRTQKRAQVSSRLVALGSEQCHSSTLKATKIANVQYRSIAVDFRDGLSLTGAAVDEAIDQCLSEGLEPFFLMTVLGTTSTGAVDRFQEIAHVMQSYPSVWMHVDAAHAGAALVCDEYHHLINGLSSFDSFNFNMHKWLLTTFDASCLWVKNRKTVTEALSVTPPYLRNPFTDSGLVTDYRDWQFSLSRRFRSLKIWFVLRTYGTNGLQSHIRRHVSLGELFHKMVKSHEHLLFAPFEPAFALATVCILPSASSQTLLHQWLEQQNGSSDKCKEELAKANSLTEEVYDLINTRGVIYVTSSVVNGLRLIRFMCATVQTDETSVAQAFKVLLDTALEVRQSHCNGLSSIQNDGSE